MAGSNTRDGLTSRGFMGFGNDSSDNRQAEHNLEENGGAANKNAALLMSSNGDKGKSKWGNLMQVSIFLMSCSLVHSRWAGPTAAVLLSV